jgi:hypothetical protein
VSGSCCPEGTDSCAVAREAPEATAAAVATAAAANGSADAVRVVEPAARVPGISHAAVIRRRSALTVCVGGRGIELLGFGGGTVTRRALWGGTSTLASKIKFCH